MLGLDGHSRPLKTFSGMREFRIAALNVTISAEPALTAISVYELWMAPRRRAQGLADRP